MGTDINELKNLVYQVFEDTDYNLYFKSFDEDKFDACAILAESYMEKARDDFFASLEKEHCDIEKARNFHAAYKLFERSLEYAARGMDVKQEEIWKQKV